MLPAPIVDLYHNATSGCLSHSLEYIWGHKRTQEGNVSNNRRYRPDYRCHFDLASSGLDIKAESYGPALTKPPKRQRICRIFRCFCTASSDEMTDSSRFNSTASRLTAKSTSTFSDTRQHRESKVRWMICGQCGLSTESAPVSRNIFSSSFYWSLLSRWIKLLVELVSKV